MLGRKDYTQDEIDSARTTIEQQLATYRELARAIDAGGDRKSVAALTSFETQFFNNLVLVLDRLFVHRIRSVSGKDGNALNEVELLTESLMGNGGVLRGNNVIKYKPAESVTKLAVGDRIALTEDLFAALAEAFLAEIERRFGQS